MGKKMGQIKRERGGERQRLGDSERERREKGREKRGGERQGNGERGEGFG